MKTFHSLFLAAVFSGGLVLASQAASGSVTQRGPSQLQLDARSQIDPSEAAPDTKGTMRLQFRDNGKVTKQTLQIQASGLEPNAQVGLTAAIDVDSNVSTIMSVPTDGNGNVNLSFQSKEPTGARTPRGQEPVPDSLSTLTSVRAICIENTGGQVVGFAWVVNATTYKYIVRRNLTPADDGGTAAGSIKLIANQQRVNFTLLAGGLTPDAEYSLVLNGTAATTATADGDGRLRIRGWPTSAPGPLEVRTLALVDGGGATVLSTALPE